jgi:hypothetical protein
MATKEENKKIMELRTFIQDKAKYMKNCLFWVDDATETDPIKKESLLKSISAMEDHCREIRKKLQS